MEGKCGIDHDFVVDAIKDKRLPNHTSFKGHTVLRRTIVGSSNIIRIPISWPPASQAGRRLNTCRRRSAY
jgi:hypothetical protein